jgi:hypothetical protein
MKTENEKAQGLIALRKLIQKKLVHVSGVNPYPEILVDKDKLPVGQLNTNQEQK